MTFKFPKLHARENGQFDIVGNGEWYSILNSPHSPGLNIHRTSVFKHAETDMELTITCARLEEGAEVVVLCTVPLDDVYSAVGTIQQNPETGIEVEGIDMALTYTVSQLLEKLSDQINN